MKQRELKFRAWYMNEMSYMDILNGWDVDMLFTAGDGYAVMQYTGLKDKNDVEIYEGDIFNCIYHKDGHTDHHYVIAWNDDKAGFYRKPMGSCGQTAVSQTMWDCTRQEILGNIHQNPELLEE